jgi:hypothetical protein
VDDVATLVLEKIANYLLIVKKLRGLGIDFPAWKCIRRLKKGNFKSFFEDTVCTDEGFRQQSFERRRKRAWRSFLRLLSINLQRLSNSDIYTLVEKMTTVIDNLDMLEKLLLQLIKAGSQFTLEKTEHEKCIKKCDAKYNNNIKLTEYLSAFIIPTVSGILYGYGVPLELTILSVFSLIFVVLVARHLIWRSYETCIDGCNKENRVMSLSRKIDKVMKDLNYVVDEISRLLGVSSSSASTDRVAYSGYLT